MRSALLAAIAASAVAALAPTACRARPPPRPVARRVTSLRLHAADDASSDELEVALLTEERLVLDVYATWCGPCALLAPQMDAAAAALEGRCRVMKFDSEQLPGGPALASSLSVGGLPTILFISEGEVLHRVEGALTAPRIVELAEGVWFGAAMPRGPEYGDFGPSSPPPDWPFPP
jgi:thiol-disulfide isomerase/thioredoxin